MALCVQTRRRAQNRRSSCRGLLVLGQLGRRRGRGGPRSRAT